MIAAELEQSVTHSVNLSDTTKRAAELAGVANRPREPLDKHSRSAGNRDQPIAHLRGNRSDACLRESLEHLTWPRRNKNRSRSSFAGHDRSLGRRLGAPNQDQATLDNDQNDIREPGERARRALRKTVDRTRSEDPGQRRSLRQAKAVEQTAWWPS